MTDETVAPEEIEGDTDAVPADEGVSAEATSEDVAEEKEG